MVFKQFLKSGLLMLLVFLTFSFNTHANMNLNISPEEAEKLEQVGDMMHDFFHGLDDKEQAEFLEQVQQEAMKIEQMSDAEKNEYLKKSLKEAMDVLDNLDVEEDDYDDDEEEEYNDEQIELKQEEKDPAKKAATDKLEKERQEAERIKQIQLFIDILDETKTRIKDLKETLDAIYPIYDYLIDKWITQDELENECRYLRSHLDKIMAWLSILDDKDVKTGNYKYIGDPTKAEALRGQLEMLRNMLRKFGPDADKIAKYYAETITEDTDIALTPKEKKNKKTAKKALQMIAYHIEDMADPISKKAETLVDTFDKTIAQKIKKEEEATQKKAEQEYKKTQSKKTPAPKIAKTPSTSSYGDGRYYDDDYYYGSDYDDNYYPYYEEPYYEGPYSQDHYNNRDYSPSRSSEKQPKKEKGKADKAKTETADATKTKKTDMTEADKSKYMKNKRLDNWLESIDNRLGEFGEIVAEDETKWNKLKEHLKTSKTPDLGIKKSAKQMSIIVQNVQKKIKSVIREIKKLKDSTAKKLYTEQFNEIKERSQSDLKKIQEKISLIKESDVKAMPQEVQETFFSKQASEEAAKGTEAAPKKPTLEGINLFELKEDITDLLKTLRKS